MSWQPDRSLSDEQRSSTEPPSSTEPAETAQVSTASWLKDMTEQLESDERFDRVAEFLDDAARPWKDGSVGQFLRGEWLGHALHPVMTDVPLGCWQAATLLDLLGGRKSRTAARRLVGFGVLSALPTAASGLIELATVDDQRVRRVGSVHALGNAAALGLYFMSYRARRRSHHLRGTMLAMMGGSLALFTGYLGGHMSFTRATGVGERWGDLTSAEAPRSVRTPAPGAATTPTREEVRGVGEAHLVGLEQAAAHLTVPVEQLRSMVDQGLLPAASTNPLRFRLEDIEAVRLQGG